MKNRAQRAAALRRAANRASRVPCLCVLCFLRVLCGGAVVIAGCRQDMHDQPKYIPLRESTFFADARSARPLVEGTVARGQLREDELLYHGQGQRPGRDGVPDSGRPRR